MVTLVIGVNVCLDFKEIHMSKMDVKVIILSLSPSGIWESDPLTSAFSTLLCSHTISTIHPRSYGGSRVRLSIWLPRLFLAALVLGGSLSDLEEHTRSRERVTLGLSPIGEPESSFFTAKQHLLAAHASRFSLAPGRTGGGGVAEDEPWGAAIGLVGR